MAKMDDEVDKYYRNSTPSISMVKKVVYHHPVGIATSETIENIHGRSEINSGQDC